MTTIVAIRIVSNAAVSFLVASFGFTIIAVAAHHTAGFKPWADGLAITGLWNFALAVALYALLAGLLVGRGVGRLIAYLRLVPVTKPIKILIAAAALVALGTAVTLYEVYVLRGIPTLGMVGLLVSGLAVMGLVRVLQR